MDKIFEESNYWTLPTNGQNSQVVKLLDRPTIGQKFRIVKLMDTTNYWTQFSTSQTIRQTI